MSAAAAARFLDQATFGPTSSDIAKLQSQGINAWLQTQFEISESEIPDQPLLNSSGNTNTNLGPVQQALIVNAISNVDQLRQRVAFILSQIWVVSAENGVNAAYAFPPYWRIFRDNAFGNYRDIIKAVTLSPAMGRYLNMANNNKGNAAKGTAANENYGRELMQLFTLGLTQLNPDGSAVVDSNKNPVPTYTPAIVTGTANLLTGWTYPVTPGSSAKTNNPAYYFGQMYAVEAEHDTDAKTIVGNVQVSSGQTAEYDLEALLDALMNQTTMAPFISKQLIQHLVTSNPSPAYVQRVSTVFLDNGSGVRGDMQAVLTAILTDPEARAGDDPTAAPNPTFGHLREPLIFLTSTLRALGAQITSASTLYNDTNLLGENLFYSPSVFSYFSPQSRIQGGLLGPEFQIYSTQTAASRADLVNSIVYGTLDKGTTVNLTPLVAQATTAETLCDALSNLFLHGSMSSNLRTAATTAYNAAATPLAKTQAALYIVLTSGEYQVIH